MRHDAVSRLPLTRLVPLVLALVALVASAGDHADPGLGAGAKVQKLVFASAGFDESNRFWVVSRPDHLQYDPFLETLLDVDPKTGEYTPRLAEKWSAQRRLQGVDVRPAQGRARSTTASASSPPGTSSTRTRS